MPYLVKASQSTLLHKLNGIKMTIMINPFMFLGDYNGLKPRKGILSRCLLEKALLALIFVYALIKSLTLFPMSFLHLSLSGIHRYSITPLQTLHNGEKGMTMIMTCLLINYLMSLATIVNASHSITLYISSAKMGLDLRI
jgi:hypothetical protein